MESELKFSSDTLATCLEPTPKTGLLCGGKRCLSLSHFRCELGRNSGPRSGGEGHTGPTTCWALNQSQINTRALPAMQILTMLCLRAKSSHSRGKGRPGGSSGTCSKNEAFPRTRRLQSHGLLSFWPERGSSGRKSCEGLVIPPVFQMGRLRQREVTQRASRPSFFKPHHINSLQQLVPSPWR